MIKERFDWKNILFDRTQKYQPKYFGYDIFVKAIPREKTKGLHIVYNFNAPLKSLLHKFAPSSPILDTTTFTPISIFQSNSTVRHQPEDK